MSFLEKVWELNKHPGLRRRARRVDFITDCWPELLSVVEAAHECNEWMPEFGDVMKLCQALAALDKKAGEG